MKSIAYTLLSLALLLASIDARGIRPRIIEGSDANIEDVPYQAMIQMSLMAPYKHICSGTIISERHILTAAHCMVVFMLPPFNLGRVITGTGLNNNDTSGQIHQIANVTIHEGFNGSAISSYRHDIAVITLADKIAFNKNQRKIELASHDVKSGTRATLTAWGRTKNGTDSVQLQKLSTTLLTSAECQPHYPDRPLFEDQFCALGDKGAGACRGDSGGPLVVDNELIGTVSWVNGGICANGTPEVYTNIYSYKDFIESVLNK